MSIDVIIPAYNAEKTLRRAVESALSHPEANIILINDGSTDGTAALCGHLAENGRVRVIHKENGGVSSARNCGLAASAGEYVTFLDADDVLLPGAMDMLLKALQESGVDAVQGCVSRREAAAGSGRLQRMAGREALRRAMSDPTACLHTHGWLYRRTLLTERFDESLTLGEDGEWMLRTLRHAAAVSFLDAPVYLYTVRPDSAVHGSRDVCAAYMRTLRAAQPALNAADAPAEAALYLLTHLLLMLTHGDFSEAAALRDEPMFASAFRAARLTGMSPRIWTLRLLKLRLIPLVRAAIAVRRRMNAS
ncbi:MAG: glycosyltransferase family 2 protein [Clostridia bacterium]|nr:glycosyltransferase family 2 protein [Clostridia bacterium]